MKRKLGKLSLVLTLLFVLLPGMIMGEDGWLGNRSLDRGASIFVEYWSSKDRYSGLCETQFFVEITPTDLVFTRFEEGYRALYHLSIIIMDRKEEILGEKIFNDTLYVDSYEKTLQYGWNRLFSLKFRIADGQYQALVTLTDDNSGREYFKTVRFDVHGKNALSINASDILFARRDSVELAEGQTYTSILPYPPRLYGADQTELFCYFEIYNQNLVEGDSVQYTISYIDPFNQQHILKRQRLWFHSQKFPVLYSFDTENLYPGTYKLQVQIEMSNKDFLIEREKDFLVYQNPIDLRFKSFEELLSELHLISTKEELEALRALPESARQQGVYDFWKKRDPTPDTPRNELLTEFYRRLNFARHYFSQENRQGIRLSDQGKVYVIFGAPDKILRQMNEDFDSQTEVWFYQKQNLQVIFRDDFGFGDYRLIAPYSLLSDL